MSLLYTFYGDDFTGSTDVLEQLATHGVPAVLFLAPPTPAQLAAFPDARAVGIAGDARSRSPEWMTANLPAVFRKLKDLGAPVMHYKVCSTFDSSPTHGSIGRALEIGLDVFCNRFVPIMAGAPHLKRYVAFGNLFAADPDNRILRIDRHPMARHPVTPMHEADLRLHLAAQTATKVGLIDLAMLNSGHAQAAADSLAASGHRSILFDTVGTHTQSTAGALLRCEAQRAVARNGPLFAIGSSGLTAALRAAWRNESAVAGESAAGGPAAQSALAAARPLLVISGSCSEATRRQIEHALAGGFHGIALDPAAITASDMKARTAALAVALHQAVASLASGKDTVLYTALGPATDSTMPSGADLGGVLGTLARDIILCSAESAGPVRRIIFCGGDTSSHATQQLGIYALTWAANLQPGAPLCRAHSDDPGLDGIELVLKGGQVGSEDFFSRVRDGSTRDA